MAQRPPAKVASDFNRQPTESSLDRCLPIRCIAISMRCLLLSAACIKGEHKFISKQHNNSSCKTQISQMDHSDKYFTPLLGTNPPNPRPQNPNFQYMQNFPPNQSTSFTPSQFAPNKFQPFSESLKQPTS
uniref:Uncharacterized protein n=1 Tax=Arundo donax TaxID=35708 RepID=A0A0A9G2A4_ARUDO